MSAAMAARCWSSTSTPPGWLSLARNGHLMRQTSRFSFVDEGEALRRLNVDRDTLLGLVREGRLRAYPGVGKGSFYRIRDLDALYEVLYGGAPTTGEPEEGETAALRRAFDPAYKVHVRLHADLKRYDLS